MAYSKALQDALDKIDKKFSPEEQKKSSAEIQAKRDTDPSYQAWKKRSDAHAPARAAAKEKFEKNLAAVRERNSGLHKQRREELAARKK